MAEAKGKAVKRSVLRIVGFSVLSPFYAFYWFYCVRQAVTAELKQQDNVGGQTLGLIVPILNLVILYWLYRDIDKLAKKGGDPGFNPLVFLLAPIVLAIIPVLGIVAPIVGLVLFAIVISKLNQYWDKQGAVDAPITRNEILVVLAGLVFLVLYIILMVTVIGNANDSVNEIENFNTQFNY